VGNQLLGTPSRSLPAKPSPLSRSPALSSGRIAPLRWRAPLGGVFTACPVLVFDTPPISLLNLPPLIPPPADDSCFNALIGTLTDSLPSRHLRRTQTEVRLQSAAVHALQEASEAYLGARCPSWRGTPAL